jgi:hypothetical protein
MLVDSNHGIYRETWAFSSLTTFSLLLSRRRHRGARGLNVCSPSCATTWRDRGAARCLSAASSSASACSISRRAGSAAAFVSSAPYRVAITHFTHRPLMQPCARSLVRLGFRP